MKFLISWDYGYGKNYEVVDASSRDEAEKQAYEQWKEDAETNAEYGVEDIPEDEWDDYI